jgi:hypothetical protein
VATKSNQNRLTAEMLLSTGFLRISRQNYGCSSFAAFPRFIPNFRQNLEGPATTQAIMFLLLLAQAYLLSRKNPVCCFLMSS